MSSCSRHPGKESVGACINCGKLVCIQCRLERNEKTYCRPCADKLFLVEETVAEAPPVSTPSKDLPVLTASAAPTPVIMKGEQLRADTEIKQAPLSDINGAAQPGLPTVMGVNILWYIGVLLLGWIGGLAAWWKNKKQAPQASRYLLFGGIGWSAVQGVLAVIMVAALVITPAIRSGTQWPVAISKPPAVVIEAEDEQASEPTVQTLRYLPPKVKRSETGTILTGAPAELANTAIDTSGGTISVDKQGDPLNGLQITVPPGAYKETKSFKVSSSPITVNTFGNGVNPISPMIKVENGGESADKAMTIKVPAQLEEGQAAIWYFYNEKTGTLEAVPTVTMDKDSVTVATTHFSEGFLSTLAGYLNNGTIDSGFRPGTDSWQFPNHGSWVSSGICNGMSLTAMWYYYNRPDGDKTLYGTYDNGGDPNPSTPGFWQDDALTYRFCSVVHHDLNTKSPNYTFFSQYYGTPENVTATSFWYNLQGSSGDKWTRRLFESSMLATHEPQMAWIYSADGKNAHALVVYKIVNGTLVVSDPNYGGQTSQIVWSDELAKYMPYSGKDNENAGNTTYERIVYAGKGTLIPWGNIQGYWSQVESKTAGDDRFPPYKLYVIDADGKRAELTDDFEMTTSRIKVELDKMGNPDLKFTLYWTDPLFRNPSAVYQDTDGYYQPEKGDIFLGADVRCDNRRFPDDDAASAPSNDVFVDFKWYKVKNGTGTEELKIEAPSQPGNVGQAYTFKALAKNLPKEAKLEWYVKNSAAEKGTGYGNVETISHTFDSPGNKIVLLQAVKDGKVLNLAKDQITFEVIQPPLEIIANPGQGAVGQTSFFSIRQPAPIPGDAKYTWSFGNGKKDEGEEASTVYDEPKTYPVTATATWVDARASPAKQQNASGELKYEVTGEQPLRIIANPAAGIINEKTAFSVTAQKIPEGVAFYWEFGDANKDGDLSSLAKDGKAEHAYALEDTYDIKVSMLDMKNPKPLAQGILRYSVMPPGTLAIVAPAEIKQGKGITEKEYLFNSTWEPGKAPSGVSYTWILNGQPGGDKADCPVTFNTEGPNNLKVKAAWKDTGGAARETESQPLDFNITAKTEFAIIAGDSDLQKSGNGVIDKQYTFTVDWSPRSIPAGVNYMWSVDGEGVEDKGGSITHKFKTEGTYTISVKAGWKDDKGAGKTTDIKRSFMMSAQASGISLTCTDSGIRDSKKGAPNKDYVFKVAWGSGKAPAGVKYTWTVNGESTDKEGATESFNFKDENNYIIKVIASWKTITGEAKSTDTQLAFKIEAATNFSVRCADGSLQTSRKGVPDQDYRFYASWPEDGSEPSGTTYSWFLNDDETGDTENEAHFKFSANPDGGAKACTVKATAKWTDASNQAKETSASIKFSIEAAATLSVKVPADIKAGRGVIKQSYTFYADAKNIPESATYIWYGDDLERGRKETRDYTFQFNNQKSYIVRVEASWKDNNGQSRLVKSSSVTFDIGSKPSLTLNAPADVKANKGVKGQKYFFNVTATNIPDGAEYVWYSNDVEKTRGKDSKSGNISFSEATDYAMKVEAYWTDSSGKSQSVNSPEIRFHINDVFTVTLTVPAEIKAGKGVKGQKYSFSVTTENIPEGAEYAWFSNGQEKTRGKDMKTGNISFSESMDYTLKVETRWTGTGGKTQFVSSPAVSFHIGSAASVSVIPPGDLSGGKGMPEKSYSFSAKPQDIPTNAEYTWYVNGTSLGKSGKDKSPLVKTEKEPKDYTVKVVARWKVNNQPKEAEGSFNFSTTTGVVLSNGVFVSSIANGEADEKFGAILVGPVFARAIINVANGKATANQSVPITIVGDKGAALNGSAKIKVDGTDNKGVLSGTFTFDSIINYVDEGKTVPIDIKYSGTFKSTAIPANPANARVTLTFTGPLQSHALVQMIVAAGAACANELSRRLGSSGGGTTTWTPPENDILCPAYTSTVNFTASVSGK